MSEYQLYSFAQSGNAYKVALMLELAGADWEPVWVDFFHGGSKTPNYLAMNEMGEVPVLVHREITLSQSGVILDYLSERYRDYAPKSEAERREVLRWLLWDNHKFTSFIATLRFLMSFAPPEKRDPAVIAFLEGRARAAMKALDIHLGSRAWIAAEHMTIADFSCAGYVYYAEEFGADMAGNYPNIERWRNAISAIPGWKHPYDLLPGHPTPGGPG